MATELRHLRISPAVLLALCHEENGKMTVACTANGLPEDVRLVGVGLAGDTRDCIELTLASAEWETDADPLPAPVIETYSFNIAGVAG